MTHIRGKRVVRQSDVTRRLLYPSWLPRGNPHARRSSLSSGDGWNECCPEKFPQEKLTPVSEGQVSRLHLTTIP